MLASLICGMPISLISLIDRDRQWFKAKCGLSLSETSRGVSFCDTAIRTPSSTLLVEDARTDARFSSNELVTGPFNLRFYAGAPIIASDVAVGALCVIGKEPGHLNGGQIDALEALARQVSKFLEARLLNHEINEKNRCLTQIKVELQAVIEDATDLSRKLMHSSERFANLFQGLPVACMTVDNSGNVMEWNEMSTRLYGYEPWESFGNNVVDLIAPVQSRQVTDETLKETARLGEKAEAVELHVRGKGGKPIWVLSKALTLTNAEGEVVGLIISSVDITDRKRAEAKVLASQKLVARQKRKLEQANTWLKNLATTDALTGIHNHRAFQDFLQTVFAGSKRSGEPLSLLLLDVDKFKSVNDDFGHPAGDAVLSQLAVILRSSARKSSFVARYGGEEFAIVLPGAGAVEAVRAAERHRSAIEQSSWSFRQVTASFGVATLTAEMNSPSELIKSADTASLLFKTVRTKLRESLQ